MPQIASRDIIAKSGHGDVTGSPYKYGTWSDSIATLPPPALDEHGDAIRAKFMDGA